jgi:hypothetical protein
MSKLNQIKIPINLEELSEELTQPAPNWKLVRERDGLTKQSEDVMWIEFGEDGFFKAKHDKPAIGRSLLMSPFNQFFVWQTTVVTEIVEQREDYVFLQLNHWHRLGLVFFDLLGQGNSQGLHRTLTAH